MPQERSRPLGLTLWPLAGQDNKAPPLMDEGQAPAAG